MALAVALAVAFDHSAVKKPINCLLQCFKVALLTGVQNRGGVFLSFFLSFFIPQIQALGAARQIECTIYDFRDSFIIHRPLSFVARRRSSE
jgi:hypothetical protein